MSTLYLTGYEKETMQEFFQKLQKAGITTVIDVREIPFSHKNGFSKENLKKELKTLGMNYYHFPKLGSPSKIRRELKERRSDYLEFFKKYRAYLKKERNVIKNLLGFISTRNKASLLCFERSSDLCHRSIIASEILKLNPNLRVIPL